MAHEGHCASGSGERRLGGLVFVCHIWRMNTEKKGFEMNSTIVRRLEAKPGNPRNSEGAFLQLAGGRIMYAYSRYKGDSWSDNAAADIAVVYSDDNGETWPGEPGILCRHDGESGNLMSVSLLRLQNGRIALAYLQKSLLEADFYDCRPLIRFSDDEGLSWSEARHCIRPPGYYVLNNDRLLQLSSGRLLLPLGFHRWSGKSTDPRAIAIIVYSDDGGISWQEAPGWILPPQESGGSGLQEPGLIELNDGRLMAWFRTGLGCQFKAYSYDEGMSWSGALPAPEFMSPRSPLSLKRAPDGRLAAVWNDHSPRWGIIPQREGWHRSPLVLAYSSDEGRTWAGHQLLESDPARGYCYTAMCFSDDALLLAYCCGGAGKTACLQDSCIRRVML